MSCFHRYLSAILQGKWSALRVTALASLCLFPALTGCALLSNEAGHSAEQPGQTTISPSPTLSEPISEPTASPLSYLPELKTAEPAAEPPMIDSLGRSPGIRVIDDPAPPYKINGEDEVNLDLEQVELRHALELIADALDITLVIDPAIADKLSIRTAPGKPLRHADLWPLLRLLTTNAGVALEQHGNVYHARKSPNVIPANIGFAAAFKESDAAVALQITPLRHVRAETALTVLRPILEHNVKFIQLDNLNMLGIIAAPAHLERVNALLGLVDADPFTAKGIRLFRLQNAEAKEVAAELEKVLQLILSDKPALGLVALERINALLVVTPPGVGFGEIERWVNILDTGNQDSYEQIFIYRVRSLNAEALADTLTKTFPRPEQSREDKPVAGDERPAPPKPEQAETKETGAPLTPAVPAMAVAEPRLSAPSADLRISIVADTDTNSLLIRATPRDYRQLLEAIVALDQASKQVMINVVIAEVTLTDSTRFGVEWGLLARGGNLSVRNVIGIGDMLTDISQARGLVVSNVGGELTSLLNFLGQKTDLRVLSRPSILVRNNQEAEIKVGSEEPILTSVINSAETIAGSTQLRQDVQYRDTGIILRVTPQINDDDIINITVEQEVSQLGEERTIHRLPSFTNRMVKTSAVVRNQSAIVLGGIIQSRLQNSRTGIPGLMHIPLLGLAFSDTTVSEVRTELVLIIVPELVNPSDDQSAFMGEFLGRMERIKQILDSNIWQ